jgi:hypothetical protein
MALAFSEKARPVGYCSPVLSLSITRINRMEAGRAWAKPAEFHSKANPQARIRAGSTADENKYLIIRSKLIILMTLTAAMLEIRLRLFVFTLISLNQAQPDNLHPGLWQPSRSRKYR